MYLIYYTIGILRCTNASTGLESMYARYSVLEHVLNLALVLSRSAVTRVQLVLNLVPCVHLLDTAVCTLFSQY